jgi:hypothetical protein
MIKMKDFQQNRMEVFSGDCIGFKFWRFHGTKGQEDYA